MMRSRQLHYRRIVARVRRGTATVELAVCLPVLLILFAGAMELSRATMVKQATVEAAYAAAREISRPGGQEAAALEICQDLLRQKGIVGSRVTFVPPQAAAASPGTIVTVTVFTPCQDNAWVFDKMLASRSLEAQVSMAKEGR